MMPSIRFGCLCASLCLAATVAVAGHRDDEGNDGQQGQGGGNNGGSNTALEFEIAELHVEQNATDGDTEIVMAAKPDTEGLRTLSIKAPNGRFVVNLLSLHPSILGLREFVFETPEPPGDAVLDAYPEGTYRFQGMTHSGQLFRSLAMLSHDLPAPTEIVSPAEDATVPAGKLVINWLAVSGIAHYVLEIQNESADPEQTLTINLPAGSTSFQVPASFVVPGADYQVGVATVGTNGNVVFVEVPFSTAE